MPSCFNIMEKIPKKFIFMMSCIFFPCCGSCPKPLHFMILRFIYLNYFYTNPSIVEATIFLLIIIILHDYHMSSFLYLLSQDLNHWVQTKCIVCFSKFHLTKYEDDKWVEIFRMKKSCLFTLLISCDLCCWSMTPNIEKLFQLTYICHVWSINWPMSTIF